MRSREAEWGREDERTLFKLESKRVYSSRTSCSRGLMVGAWCVGGEGSAIVLAMSVVVVLWRSGS